MIAGDAKALIVATDIEYVENVAADGTVERGALAREIADVAQLAKKYKVCVCSCRQCITLLRTQSPLIYALTRTELAAAVNKPGGASVVTVLYEQGAEVAFKVRVMCNWCA